MGTTTKPSEVSGPAGLKPVERPTKAPSKRRSFAGVFWLLLLGALGYGGYRYYQFSHQKTSTAGGPQRGRQSAGQISVVATAVRTGDIPVYLRGLGSVSPFNSVVV